MTRTLLIDGDIVIYQYSATVEKEVNWGDDVWSLWADAKEAKKLILQYIDLLMEKTAADKLVFCFTGKDNFRKNISNTYKSNRKDKRKPVCYKAIKEWLEENYDTEEWYGLEADDVLGILATSGDRFIEGEKVIVSEDKDLKTIPCKLWRSGELLEITKEEADYNHLFQTLTGDSTDGYSGLRGVGEVKAKTILAVPTWESVENAFIKAGYTKEDALTQARLARILRFEDYNFEYDTPNEWNPK